MERKRLANRIDCKCESRGSERFANALMVVVVVVVVVGFANALMGQIRQGITRSNSLLNQNKDVWGGTGYNPICENSCMSSLYILVAFFFC